MGVIIRGKATIELVHEFGPTYSDNELEISRDLEHIRCSIDLFCKFIRF